MEQTEGHPKFEHVTGRREERATALVDLEQEVRALVQGLPALRPDVQLCVCAAPGLRASIEPSALRQLLLNVILNAGEALPGTGDVRITIARAPNQGEAAPRALFVVEDNGEGMTRDVQLQAVDPFFSTKQSEGHVGLGLSVTSALVEQAGGTFSLKSAKGVGTRVAIELPLADESDAANDATLKGHARTFELLLPDHLLHETATPRETPVEPPRRASRAPLPSRSVSSSWWSHCLHPGWLCSSPTSLQAPCSWQWPDVR